MASKSALAGSLDKPAFPLAVFGDWCTEERFLETVLRTDLSLFAFSRPCRLTASY